MQTIEGLAARYIGQDGTVSPDLVDDAAGEFANVIAGQAKTMLKGTPWYFTLSTPTSRRTSIPESAADANQLTLFFDCDSGAFALQIARWQ